MENGHVEIYDPICSGANNDPACTSETEDMVGTVEFRIMMAYATRRRPKKDVALSTQDSPITLNGGTDTNEARLPEKGGEEEEEEKEKKKKKVMKGWKKRLPSILSCIKPQTVDEKPPQTAVNAPIDDDDDNRLFVPNKEVVKTEEKDQFEEVASRLTEIADEVPFIRPEIESDHEVPESQADVEKVIGLLLRDAGDKLNQEALNKSLRASEIFWNYSFYKMVIRTLLERMGLLNPHPESLGPQASPKTQIAVTCEVTSRLSAVDTLPVNRMLGHGARYLQENYSSWVQQQGGYEEAFYSEDEDDSQ